MIEQVHETSKVIAEMGIMVTICSVFLIGTIILFISSQKSQKKDRDDYKQMNAQLIADLKGMFEDLAKETRMQNQMLTTISEGLLPETILRIKNISSWSFDLSAERVARILNKVREENGIADHEKTHKKIMLLVTNLHKDRNSKFDSFTWQGKKLSKYVNPDWIQWVSDVVEKELYSEDINDKRTYSNIKNIYDTIKIDFYERLGIS